MMLISVYVQSEPELLLSIPLECTEVNSTLSKAKIPNGFTISVVEAHIIAMQTTNIIKPCASKLEQVILYDSENYYVTNSVNLLKKNRNNFPAVKINGKTGVAINDFENT